jgi:hypothetical protein
MYELFYGLIGFFLGLFAARCVYMQEVDRVKRFIHARQIRNIDRDAGSLK